MSVDSDVALYESISELIREDQNWKSGERRGGERRPYACLQLLAQFDGKRLPHQSRFAHVQCQDLSEEGFAYLTNEAPLWEYVIVALGQVPFKFFVAEVRHVDAQDPEAAHKFLVGCRFLKRLKD